MFVRPAAFVSALMFLALLSGAAQAKHAASPQKPNAASNNLLGSKHDKDAPISISSDHFDGDLQTKVGTYVGNVIVIQGDYKLRADKMNLHVINGALNTIDGAGNVLFNSGIETASGDTGVYDLTAHTVTLDGKVILTKEKDVMRGTHLVMNLDTNKAQLTAKGATNTGGRVTGLFIPAKKNGSDAPPQSQTNGKPPAN